MLTSGRPADRACRLTVATLPLRTIGPVTVDDPRGARNRPRLYTVRGTTTALATLDVAGLAASEGWRRDENVTMLLKSATVGFWVVTVKSAGSADAGPATVAPTSAVIAARTASRVARKVFIMECLSWVISCGGEDDQRECGVLGGGQRMGDLGLDVNRRTGRQCRGLIADGERHAPGLADDEDRPTGGVLGHRLAGTETETHDGGPGEVGERLDGRPGASASFSAVSARPCRTVSSGASAIGSVAHGDDFDRRQVVAILAKVLRMPRTRCLASRLRMTFPAKRRAPPMPSSAMIRRGCSSAIGAKRTVSTVNPASVRRAATLFRSGAHSP